MPSGRLALPASIQSVRTGILKGRSLLWVEQIRPFGRRQHAVVHECPYAGYVRSHDL